MGLTETLRNYPLTEDEIQKIMPAAEGFLGPYAENYFLDHAGSLDSRKAWEEILKSPVSFFYIESWLLGIEKSQLEANPSRRP